MEEDMDFDAGPVLEGAAPRMRWHKSFSNGGRGGLRHKEQKRGAGP
ncbi:MAG: hypothetical protein ACLR0U_13140 [Enterocloster clostridioformis]